MPFQQTYDWLKSHLNINDHVSFATWLPAEQALYVIEEFARVTRGYIAALKTETRTDDVEFEEALKSLLDEYLDPLVAKRPYVASVVAMTKPLLIKAATEALAEKIQQRAGS